MKQPRCPSVKSLILSNILKIAYEYILCEFVKSIENMVRVKDGNLRTVAVPR